MPRPNMEWDRDAVPLSPTCARDSALNLIEVIEAEFAKHLVTEPGIPLLLAVWSLATHVFQQFRAFPYLAITSPIPECGKTTVLDVLELFCARPKRRLSMTPASLYRCIEREQPTLLIDEQQLIGTRTQQALKELLDQGYKRGGQVERSGASGGVFDVYCPKAIALIGQLPDTLATRCIPIYMDPLGPDDVVDPYIPQRGEDPYLTLLQGACVEWANVEGNGLHRNYVACLRGGAMGFQRSRRRNLAVFVHRMSNCRASPHQRLKGLADRLLATRQDLGHQHVAIRLLSDLREILDRVNGNRIRSEALVQELRRIEDWSTINEKVTANILAPFRFYPTRIRLGPDTYRGNYVASFQRVFRQYLPPRPERVRHDTVSA